MCFNLVGTTMDKAEVQKKAKQDIAKRVNDEEDYIRCKKFSNSLNKFVANFPDGVDNSVIARILMIPEDQIEVIYNEAVLKLRAEMVQKDED